MQTDSLLVRRHIINALGYSDMGELEGVLISIGDGASFDLDQEVIHVVFFDSAANFGIVMILEDRV